jgi:LETM1 and EF-hand domain-containing protein 1
MISLRLRGRTLIQQFTKNSIAPINKRFYCQPSEPQALVKVKSEKQKELSKPVIEFKKDPLRWLALLPPKIWDVCVHTYHGFRLLTLNVATSSRLLWRTLKGEDLSRREHHLMVVTVADIFRMIPFSFFIIVPFAEFALPFVIKFFPNILPSTFTTKDDQDEKWRNTLKLRMSMAKFVTETAEEMKSQSAGFEGNFKQFMKEVSTGQPMTFEQTLQFVKSFKDDLTIDNLKRSQIQQMCRFIGINPHGPTMFLKILLLTKVDELLYDDKIIKKEGLSKLSLVELKNACAARGMNSSGTRATLEKSLEEWLELTLIYRVPAVMLILSRAFRMYSESLEVQQELETVARTVKYIPPQVIEDVEDEVDIVKATASKNLKGKLEAIKEEISKIKEEKEELEDLKLEQQEGVAHSIDAIEPEPVVEKAVVETDIMVDELEKEAYQLKKKIEVEVADVHTETSETDYSTTLIETKLKKMVADIEKEIAKKDEEYLKSKIEKGSKDLENRS